jgi:hypothetical protein
VCTMSQANSATRSSAVLCAHSTRGVKKTRAIRLEAAEEWPYMMRSESLGRLEAPCFLLLFLCRSVY